MNTIKLSIVFHPYIIFLYILMIYFFLNHRFKQ